MWEAIGKVFTSGNGPVIVIGLVLIILLVVLMAKSGLLKVNVKGVKIGNSERDKERMLIREQCSWAQAFLKRLEVKIDEYVYDKMSKATLDNIDGKDLAVAAAAEFVTGIDTRTGVNNYLTKYIIELEYDEVVNWIIFNHITDNPTYISMKQTKALGIIYANCELDIFKSKEFVDMISRKTEELIKGLISIRKLYEENR